MVDSAAGSWSILSTSSTIFSGLTSGITGELVVFGGVV
jgi:hypothetical protein